MLVAARFVHIYEVSGLSLGVWYLMPRLKLINGMVIVPFISYMYWIGFYI